MSVLNTIVIPGLDATAYDQLAPQLEAALQAAPGFCSHVAYSGESGGTVVEVWDNKQQLQAFFDAKVKRGLLPSVAPTVVELHNVVSVRGN